MAKFELKITSKGHYYFQLKAANGQILVTSELYLSKAAAENGIESVKRNAANAETVEA